MLKHLKLRGVGPAPEMRMDLAPRLNVITGDNGLGKSFLLDVAWWALTRTWARLPARPAAGVVDAEIEFSLDSATKEVARSYTYDRKAEDWPQPPGRPPSPGLVIYAQVDGGFSIWDPARNYWRTVNGIDVQDRAPAFLFSPTEVWDGLRRDGHVVCKGLLDDWASWQSSRGGGGDASSFPKAGQAAAPQAWGPWSFDLLCSALATMSPSPDEHLQPGPLTRLSVDDGRDYPTVRSGATGQDVPIVYASAGIRRIAAMCYLLVWAWTEHRRASELLGQVPTERIIVLVDEIDTHLHPRWQRRVLPALLDVMRQLAVQTRLDVQVLVATHAPLVLASIEPLFDESRDQLWHLAMEHGHVELRPEPWAKQGDVINWLVSDLFGLKQARSVEAERAIEAAEAFMRNDTAALPAGLTTRDEIHDALIRLLPGQDEFWPRWIVTTQRTARATAP